MKNVNLIPGVRRAARAQRARMRCCVAVCSGYAVLALAAGVGSWVTWGGSEPATTRQMAKADAEIDHATRLLADAHNSLGTVKSALAANAEVLGQPDWSELLAVLAERSGEDILLRDLRLELPAPQPAAAAAAPLGAPVAGTVAAAAPPPALPAGRPTDVRLNADGLGRSQLAVSQFVLRLERTGLFRKVGLIDTNREAFLNGEAIGFKLECSLGGATGEAK